MPLENIFILSDEFKKYSFEKFGARLKALREKVQDLNNRADNDFIAFQNYKAHNKPALFSHKGYIQWQGSTAQELLWDDLPEYMNNPERKPKDLWLSRPEYRDEFPLHAFRDKIKQEIRTEKYLRTREARANGENV